MYVILLLHPGGNYGYARATLGIFPGYIVGVCETFSFIVNGASVVFYFGSTMSFIFDTDYSFEPLYWLIIYAVVLVPLLQNGEWFWKTNAAIGLLVFAILLIFYLGYPSSVDSDFLRHTHSSNLPYFHHGFEGFWRILSIPTIFFLGIEIVPLSSEEVIQVSLILQHFSIF